MIEPPPELVALTRRACAALGSEVLGLDALETASGWVVLEANDVPGLRGFAEPVLDAVAKLLLRGLASSSGAS